MVNSAASEFGCDGVRELVEHLEGKENTGLMSCSEAENSGEVICYKGAEMGSGEEVKVKEEVVACSEYVTVGELGCLIEKEMENVNLNGAFSVKEEAQVMNSEDIDGVKSSAGDHYAKITTTGNGNEEGVTSHEVDIGKDESSSESESESDTSSSSSSSASSSDDDNEDDDDLEDNEGCNINRKDTDIEEGEILACGADDMVAWSDDGDDGVEGSGPKGPIRSKNELQELPFVPPVNVTIQPHHQTLPVGSISSILGAQVIVEGMEKHNPLNEGSILWITETRTPLGIVDEIFGPVKNPYYIVRYNSEDEVPDGIQQGTLVSFVQEFAHHVLNDKNIYKKGYDASGENDEELSDEGEFSDDEKEAEYKRMMKMKKRGGPTEQRFGGNTTLDKKVRNRPAVYQKQNQTTAGGGGNFCNGNTSVPPVDQSQPAQGSTLAHQLAQFHGGGAPSSGGGMPCQQQPQNSWSPSFPMMQPPQQMMMMSFPAMNMHWGAPQNHPQPMFNMPMGNAQGNPAGPLFPANFMVPGAQPGFGIFNQQQSLGQSLPMVNPGQQMLPPNAPQSGSPFGQVLPMMNLSHQMVPPNAPQSGTTSNDSWPPPASAAPESHRSSDQPRSFRGGRQTNRRGGGRFRGGRGRPQNN
ncbi:hypothetical protein DM860_009413 [Cuscuta australis]|uniref:H/ACA ribonucleoprotein complex non-core subunit NAF1 n=1 Tax=Cuscuta australis TaxID=267555 RepID=A0A328DBY1_9ASTE|nr:hypothetical protein DM860_009413 [Cuscuta australis]